MNKREVAQLLTVLSGYDRRVVEPLTVEAWHAVPEVAAASYEVAHGIVVAHVGGPNHREYFTVGVLAEGLRAAARATKGDVEADVRVAKALGFVEESHGRREPLPAAASARLAAYRAERRAEAERYGWPPQAAIES